MQALPSKISYFSNSSIDGLLILRDRLGELPFDIKHMPHILLGAGKSGIEEFSDRQFLASFIWSSRMNKAKAITHVSDGTFRVELDRVAKAGFSRGPLPIQEIEPGSRGLRLGQTGIQSHQLAGAGAQHGPRFNATHEPVTLRASQTSPYAPRPIGRSNS